MPTRQLDGFLRRLRAVTMPEAGGVTDAHLLESFIARKDEAAFAALVRRHGPMVWGVCRRVLGQVHDAEDAFQATFLVLVRKATAVLPRAMVGNWLYGVAYRTAMKARATSIKRRTKEKQVEVMPEPPTAQRDLRHDLLPVLDQELDRLPDKYRAAVVLCDLQGKTHKEAARQLGWPVGTLSTRLVRGRAILAKRLGRYGLAVSAGILATMLSQAQNASASAPASVVYSTIKVATLVAAGKATAGVISAKVAALTEGVVKTMLLKKLKLAIMVLLGFASLGSAGGLLYQTQAAEQQKTQTATEKPGRPESPSETDEPGRQDVLAKGTRAFALKLSKDQKIPDGVVPGMAVDVIAEISEPIRTGFALVNVKLLAIDANREGGQTVVTVQVAPTQQRLLILAQEEGTAVRIKAHVTERSLNAQKEAADKKDELQGAWEVVSVVQGGKHVEERFFDGQVWVFTGNMLKGVSGKMTYTLYPSEKPKAIDVIYSRKKGEGVITGPGIYELKGDELKIVLRKGGNERPKEFEAKDANTTLTVLKRLKIGAAPVEKPPTVNLRQGRSYITLAPNRFATHAEGLVLAMLGDCSVSNSQVATEERWSAILKGDHVHIVYPKPRPLTVFVHETGNGKDEVWQVSEIVVPMSSEKFPDYIFVRAESGYGAFAKYGIRETQTVQKLIKYLVEVDEPRVEKLREEKP